MPFHLPYGLGNWVLLGVQSSLIGLTGSGLPRWAHRFSGRLWAIVLPVSIGGTIGVLMVMPGLALILTWLSLITFPILAVLAIGWAMHRPRQIPLPLSLCAGLALVVPAFVCAVRIQDVKDKDQKMIKDVCGMFITALSVVTLGRLLVGVVVLPGGKKWGLLIIRAALILTAVIDSWLVFTEKLQEPNAEINNATPVVPVPPSPHHPNGTTFELPKLQYVTFQGWLIGYEDVFVAGVFGAVLAEEQAGVPKQWLFALGHYGIALLWSLLFYAVHTLPDTVPCAIAALLFWGPNRSGKPTWAVPPALLEAELTQHMPYDQVVLA